MTAALKPVNIRRALEKGKSVTGPWEVEMKDNSGEMVLDLYHYGHRLARVSKLQATGGGQASLEAWPRPGFGFSKSDVEAIGLLAQETNADIRNRENVRYHHQSPYSGFGLDHPFPKRRTIDALRDADNAVDVE